MTQQVVGNVVRTVPDLWIERVVIFDDVPKKSVIRDIPLQRGLNIIYGVSEVEDLLDPPADVFFMGHSVGKTSFCRLIRYALGEDTLGQEDYVKQINATFPNGGIAIDLHLNETKWSVLRWFKGGNARSYASETQSIEELAGLKKLSQTDYKRFRESLQKSVEDIPGFDQQGDFKWGDLLAWMSRDQEARYESLWKWRDTRSDSTSGPTKPAAVRLIGNVLGLFSEETNRLVRRQEYLRAELTRANGAIAAHERRRAFDIASYDADIRNILAKYGHTDEIDNELFSVETTIPACQDTIQQLVGNATSQRESLAWHLHGNQIQVRRINEHVAIIRANLRLERDGIETKSRLGELEDALDAQCKYGGIPVAQCNYFIDNLKSHKDNIITRIQDGAALDGSDTSREKVDQLIQEEYNVREALVSAQEGIGQAMGELNSLDHQIGELKFDIDQLTRLSVMKSRSASQAPQSTHVEEIASQIKAAEAELALLLSEQAEADRELRALFNRLIQFMFSEQFRGTIKPINTESLQFSIVGKGGEAVGTLTSVMADLAAVLLSVEGYGHHPRFLIHDSPREADLAAAAYGSFLAKVHALAIELGAENAPFQYIVTTTTKPPIELDGNIRLRLCGYPESDMLFKRDINADVNGALDFAETS